jgi:hypothetical protein
MFSPLWNGFVDMEAGISLLAIFGIFIMPMIMVIAIVWIKSSEKRKRSEYEANLYAKAIERGQELPKDLLGSLEKNTRKKSSLEKGIILISVGVGISLFFMLTEGVTVAGFSDDVMEGAALGIIPAVIGAGHLLVHFLVKKPNRKPEEDEQ